MTTYAIVQTGGKQYRVEPGTTLRVESLSSDRGREVEFEDVLLVSRDGEVTLGTPTVPGARVKAEVVSNGRGGKIIVLKYKNKTRYRVKRGHRQAYTEVKITDISVNRRRKAKAE